MGDGSVASDHEPLTYPSVYPLPLESVAFPAALTNRQSAVRPEVLTGVLETRSASISASERTAFHRRTCETSALKFEVPYIKNESAAVCDRSEEHTSELQSHHDLVCRLLLE